MTTLRLGQRVRTLVDAPALWPGAFAAPAGTVGIITRMPNAASTSYGVALGGDPDRLPSDYQPGEIAPA